VRKVGYLQRLYRDAARSTEHKIMHYNICLYEINALNAELNPICYLLLLLGDLTFMGP
jgi:hypothetical protein